MTDREEFEKWVQGVWDVETVTEPEMSAALETWNARQPEIDALSVQLVRAQMQLHLTKIRAVEESVVLKAEIALLKETSHGVMEANTALKQCRDLAAYADVANTLTIIHQRREIRKLKVEVEKLRADAERWDYCIKYGFPILYQTGWRAPLHNGRLTGGSPFASANEAIDVAMKEMK